MADPSSRGETGDLAQHRKRLRRGDRAAIGLAHVGLILGVVALALGASGLAIALTHAGARGATGSPGSNGTPGPGALVVESINAGETVLRGSACTYFYGSNTSISVGGAGTLVAVASVEMATDHGSGVTDAGYISLVNTSAACDPTAAGNAYDEVLFPPGLSSDVYTLDYTLIQTLAVGASGTYSFSIIGDQTTGTDSVEFYGATLLVTFYPA